MTWSGTVHFGSTYAVFFGQSHDNDLHHHAAFQIILSESGELGIVDRDGRELAGSGFIIRPLVDHAITSHSPVTIIYLDPHSPLATNIVDQIGTHGICSLSRFTQALTPAMDESAVLEFLDQGSNQQIAHIDARLVEALAELGREPGRVTISKTALRCGISESRLRAIARDQLGVPLSTWLIWRKLERSVREIVLGASLTEAAVAGGFSDQAHFSRAMRRMLGVTPQIAEKLVA